MKTRHNNTDIHLFVTENWLTIDVTYVVKNWLEYKYSLTHAIHITCKTCGMDKNRSPISFHTKLKPFLIIYTHSQRRREVGKHRRARRSSDCTSNSKECCRERLLVSFADIGWDNWIIKPKEYNAYFCRGSCTSPSALTLSSSQHNGLLQVNISFWKIWCSFIRSMIISYYFFRN